MNSDHTGRLPTQRGGARPVRVGQAGERNAGITGSKTRIRIHGTPRKRIPDHLTPTTLTEVKNVQSLSLTQQLRDFITYCQQTGRDFELFVRPTTRLSGPLQEAIARDAIILAKIPGL